MSRPLTTAVIVTYQSRGVIGETLRIARESHEQGLLECVVVDNASADGTGEYVQAEHPWVRFVPSGGNLGFGRGCNLGLQHVDTPYVLFLNPDASLEPAALSRMVEFIEQHPDVGVVAPAIVDPDGGMQAAGGLPTPRTILANAGGVDRWRKEHEPIVPGEPPRRVDWVCGAILLADKALIDRLRGFDPRFFLYFEETDLCLRVAQQGAQLWTVGEAVARHAVGSIAKSMNARLFQGCIADHYFQSRFYYLVKHHGWLAAAAADLGELALMTLKVVPRWLRGKDNRDLWIRLRAPIMRMPPKVEQAGLTADVLTVR